MAEECMVTICTGEDTVGFMGAECMVVECMYNNGFGGPFGGYGLGGGPYGAQDPNNPYGAPTSPPGFWISFLRVVSHMILCLT